MAPDPGMKHTFQMGCGSGPPGGKRDEKRLMTGELVSPR